MIRITAEECGGSLKVAGDLTGEWADFLEQECIVRLAAESALSLDLSDLRRVDDAGIETLRRLKKRGTRLTHCPRVVAELIDGCGRSKRASRRG